jgi:hypothetical protein
MKKRSCLSIMLIALAGFTAGYSQDYSKKLEKAAQLHKNYSFTEAAQIYRSVLQSRPDSTLATEADSTLNMELHSMAIACENGENLLKFGSSPVLVAKKSFPLNTFHLNFPGFEDGTWMTPPAEYSKGGGVSAPFNAMNFQEGDKMLVFSAQDESGAWNIMYSVRLNDTAWSAPQIANENITTAGNEILPHLSPCGKKLYFASNGHSGMGGYDLYVSEWNEETSDWDTAQNLGFPYSSTGNDWLYRNTPCGTYTVFASDRETSENEVTIYATLTEVMPLKQEIPQDQASARAIFAYGEKKAAAAAKEAADNSAPLAAEQTAYLEAIAKMKEMQAGLDAISTKVQAIRDSYATADSLTRLEMEKHLIRHEKDIMAMGDKISLKAAEIQNMELDMIGKGIDIPNPDRLPAATAAPAATLTGAGKDFTFASYKPGKAPAINFEKIEPAKDLSLKIEAQAYIADLSELPQGLVYHIQIMTAARKVQPKALKGFSPVFERRVQSGKYTYSVGVFSKYAEALKHLNTVKKRGFPTAMITAYNNGKSVSTKQAREIEKQDNSIYRVTIAGYETLPADAITVIRSNTSRDIAKANVNGVMKYVIGPFTGKNQAEALATALMAQNITGVEIEKLENK